MPKRKANWWPPSILSDPDVLSVDDEGRFVLCKICHVHYAVHGGKKPKPVIMNSNFRTRAWDVHKERTNSHRMQKRLQQAKTQQPERQQTTDTQVQQAQEQRTTDTQAQRQQQQQQTQPGQTPRSQQSMQEPQQMQQAQRKQPEEQQTQNQRTGQSQDPQTQGQSQSIPALSTQAQTLTKTPPRQGQAPAPAPRTQRQMQHHSLQQATVQSQSEAEVLQQQQQQHGLEETKDAGHKALQASTRNSVTERPVSAAPESITAAIMSRDSRTHHSGLVKNTAGKRPASTAPDGAPTQRRRVFRAGSPGSSMQLLAESEVARRATGHAYERNSFMVPGPGNNAKKTVPSEHDMAMEQQADSSARWRHMHDDVSRALNAAPRRRQQGPASYTSGELRAAKTLARTETGDLGSNNSEKVAKKLRSLNAEYHASNMRHADAYNMRHSETFDRRSAGYKEYWGTLRDVYTSSGTTSGGSGNAIPHRKSRHRSGSSSVKQTAREASKEAEADSTTPDDSGSSEDAFKPVVVVHDASLINAIERLTDATSKQIANLYEKKTSDTKDTLAGLTSVMTDLRVQHGNAIGRIIELQEKHLKVMESILEVKLRKEAARNGKHSFCCNDSTTASSSGSGSSPDSSTSGVSTLPNQVAENRQRD
ncbi:hypothetical protein PRNP1_009506 [Phytophthora ramorum]